MTQGRQSPSLIGFALKRTPWRSGTITVTHPAVQRRQRPNGPQIPAQTFVHKCNPSRLRRPSLDTLSLSMGLLDKIKDKVSSSSSGQAHFAPPSAPPSSADIPRYRKQRGVNLGAWFVQEPFFNSDVFRNAEQPKGSDLDIAKGKDAKAILERHWDSWITDEDWKWIRERGFNSVRIPVGGMWCYPR